MQTTQSKHKKWHEKNLSHNFFPHIKKCIFCEGGKRKRDLGKCDPTHLTKKSEKKTWGCNKRWAALNFALCQGINRIIFFFFVSICKVWEGEKST